MKLFFSILLIIFLSGCITKNGFLTYGNKHPEIAAEFCAEEYPAKDSLIEGKTDTIVKTDIRTDTVTVTLINTVTGKPSLIKVPCPPCKSTVRTIYHTDTIIRIDKAKEAVLINNFNNEHDAKTKAETERDNTKKENKSLRIMSVIAILAFFICLFLLIKR